MAVPTTGNGAIWQVQASAGDGLEATANSASANNVLLFNDTTRVIGDGGFYVFDTIIIPSRASPENESVDADDTEIQDMGVSTFDITLLGISGKTNNDDASNPVNKLQKWWKDGNTAALFTKGRYGLRLDDSPQWNVVPTSTFGLHLRPTNFHYIGERKQQCELTIRMSLGGAITSAF